MQASACIRGVPRPERGAAAAVADPYEEQIARLDPYLLRCFRRDQVIGGHVITRLQPRQPPHPRNVNQQPPADNPVAGHPDGELSRPPGSDRVRADAVEEGAVEDHVTESIDMTVGVAVDVHGQLVHGEMEPGQGTGLVPRRVIWWMAGSGLSGDAWLSTGAASDTVRPRATSLAAATTCA